MTGRPGNQMEMNGGSATSYLAGTPFALSFMLVLMGLESKGLLDFQGDMGSLPLYGGVFAKSYSV